MLNFLFYFDSLALYLMIQNGMMFIHEKIFQHKYIYLLMEKLAFQCANMMGKSFNMAHPFLDVESAELRLNFVHDSIAKNGIACVVRKTPAKIRLEKDKLIEQKYVDLDK